MKKLVNSILTVYQTVVFWKLFILGVIIFPIILFPLRFSPKISRTIFYLLFKGLCKIQLFFLFGVKVKNEVKLAEGLDWQFVVCNHPGLIDSMVILANWPRPVSFFLADIVANLPIGRLFADLTGYLPIGHRADLSAAVGIYQGLKNPSDLVLFTDQSYDEQTQKLVAISGRTTLKINISGPETILPKNSFLVKPGLITLKTL